MSVHPITDGLRAAAKSRDTKNITRELMDAHANSTEAIFAVPMEEEQRKITAMACSLLLDYPDDHFIERLEAVRTQLPQLPERIRDVLIAFCDAADSFGLRALQEHYVTTFDQRRRSALYLTYYTHGDTRGRGQAILAIRELLREAGFELEGSELADYLPIILEFRARDNSGTAQHLLEANREGLEVIRTSLVEGRGKGTTNCQASPYTYLLDAVVAMLPEPDAQTIVAYRKLISQGPPAELVGIGNPTSTPLPPHSQELA